MRSVRIISQNRTMGLNQLEKMREEWQIRAMGTAIDCHTVVDKDSDGIEIQVSDLL